MYMITAQCSAAFRPRREAWGRFDLLAYVRTGQSHAFASSECAEHGAYKRLFLASTMAKFCIRSSMLFELSSETISEGLKSQKIPGASKLMGMALIIIDV